MQEKTLLTLWVKLDMFYPPMKQEWCRPCKLTKRRHLVNRALLWGCTHSCCHRQIDLSTAHYSHFIARGKKYPRRSLGKILVRPKADISEQNTVRTHFGQPVPSVAHLALLTLLSNNTVLFASSTTSSEYADACVRSCSGRCLWPLCDLGCLCVNCVRFVLQGTLTAVTVLCTLWFGKGKANNNSTLCVQQDTCLALAVTYSSKTFNLLNPTDYVMHQQFNIQQLYALPTLYLCVLYLSQNKQRLVPLTA